MSTEQTHNGNHVMNTYGSFDVSFERGEGCYLWDSEGRQYLDALSGIAVCGLGHAHPAVANAVAEQATKLVHTSNLYNISNQQQLADALCAESGLDRVFFSNSGAEANEAAIKIARIYGHSRNIKTPNIIVMESAFHGRTMATLSATGSRKVHAGFEPLVQGFVRVPYDDVTAIEKVAASNNDVVAVMLEPIQGEGGINVPSADYLASLRRICDDNDWLLITDEIQTGMGRTGKWFAFQHSGIMPDVMTLAKSLANGVPIGACLAKEHIAALMKPGTHGSTFGGNPLSCAAGLAVVSTIRQEHIVAKAERMGDYVRDGLTQALANVDGVREIRGMGLMIGIELAGDCSTLMAHGIEAGILFSVQNGNTIRLLPPLIIDRAVADELISMITNVVCSHLEQKAA